MKSSDLTKDTVIALKSINDAQELKAFNNKRAARGLQPVTQEEFDELSLKITQVWANQTATVVH